MAEKNVVHDLIEQGKAKGKLTFAKKGASKLKLNKKTGAITVPKKLKPGTYQIKVKVTAKGGKGYKAASKTVKVKVKVTKAKAKVNR